MILRGLVHAHSSHSFDCLLPPLAYLAYARWRRLDFLCLTDHNTIAGSMELVRRNRDPNLQIVIGAEYATDRGDVIGLFLTDEVTARRWDDVVDAIHSQGGLVLLPHPHRNHQLDESTWSAIDLVEVFNARSSAASNAAALEDAARHGTAQTAGADVHTAWELIRNQTLLSLGGEGDLKRRFIEAPRTMTTRLSSRQLTRYSQVVKAVRKRAGYPGTR
jgi:predicted metal-dependent phosphoesterase TrpH